MLPQTQDELRGRIAILESFRKLLESWPGANGEENAQLRRAINRGVIATRTSVNGAGIFPRMDLAPPPATGGIFLRNLDPFDHLFTPVYRISLVPAALDAIDQALGVYEHLLADDGVIQLNSRDALDIASSIERALRPSFSAPPTREKEVQDVVATILRSLGVNFHREKETAPVGPKSFVPDFTVPNLNLAIETKLASPNHPASAVQEELTADIAAYRTRWKHLLVVVYDLGVISDPHRLRDENMKHFGITVIVVKH